jgi:hypothetical protein
VRRLLASGEVSAQVLRAADREADLLEHPYIGVEHLALARLKLAGRTAEREALLQRTTVGVRRRWWRPRGRYSALRRQGLEESRAARRAAERATDDSD